MVSREDGLIVSEASMEGIRSNAVAALASSLTKRIGDAALASGVGAPLFLHIQATDSVLMAATAGAEMLIVAVAETGVNVGLARLALIRTADAVQ